MSDLRPTLHGHPPAGVAGTEPLKTVAPAGRGAASGPTLRRGTARTSEGYLHIGADWRITFADLGTRHEKRRERPEYHGKLLWDLFPDIRGTPFEQEYRAAMAARTPRVFTAHYGPLGAVLENRLFPAGDGIALYYRDVTQQQETERQLERRRLQQAAVARLGQLALEDVPASDLVEEAVREVAALLQVPFAKFVSPTEGGDLVLQAGVGWRDGIVGQARVASGPQSQAGYAIAAHGPVVVEDLAKETRFTPAPLFVEHGIVSGMSVLVGQRDAPIGVLGAHSMERRSFSEDDLNFLQAVANLLAAALTRSRIEDELRSHRDHLEALVQERTRLLQESLRELEAFSYSVSHDLRAPLRAVDGFSQLLATQYGRHLPPSGQALVGRVREGAQRMGHLIESLLGLARLGRAELVWTDVDLTAQANAILNDLQARDPHRQVRWTVEPRLQARGDADLLRIALANLLENAWKFTQGKQPAVIHVGREPGGVIAVRDNGAGFDAAHASRLFEPFQRMHTLAEFEGTGVGLATVQRIIHRHGGRVWADAKPRQGAVFRFALPPAAGPSPAPSAAAQPVAPLPTAS